MKKRFLAIVLTLVMALALAVPSFAAITMPTTYLSHELLVDEVPGSVYDSVIHQNWANTNNTLLKVIHNSALYGYVNIFGTQVVQEKYNTVGNFSTEGLAWAMRDSVAAYVNAAGTEVISVGVATPHDFSNGLARIEDHHGNTYFIDTTGKVIFNIGLSKAGEFDGNGLNWVLNANGKYGVVNKLGQEVAHFIYDKVSIVNNRLYYNSGLLRAERNGLVVFLNTAGKEVIVIDPVAQGLTFIDDFSNGMCLVKDVHSQVGYMDTTGWLAVYCQFEDGKPFNAHGIALIKRAGKYGYVRFNNTYAVQPEYDYLDEVIVDNLVVAGKYTTFVAAGQQVFTVDANGHVVATNIPGSSQTYMQFGFVNVVTGQEQIALQYDSAHRFSEGLAQVSKYAAKGFINAAGTVVIYDTFYDALGDFHGGRAWAAKNGKYGYINTAGLLAISAMFDIPVDRDPYDFQGTMALVRMADFTYINRYGIINNAGNWLYTPTFSDIIYFNPQVDQVALFQYAGVNNAIVLLTR